jgi:hypothetical protein
MQRGIGVGSPLRGSSSRCRISRPHLPAAETEQVGPRAGVAESEQGGVDAV